MRALAPLRVDVALGSARLDGSLLAAPTEASLRSAATLEVEVLLQGDMWAAGVGDDHPATAALLAGLRSAQDEPAGWNAAVLPALDFRRVTVVNSTALCIALRHVAFYQIDAGLQDGSSPDGPLDDESGQPVLPSAHSHRITFG